MYALTYMHKFEPSLECCIDLVPATIVSYHCTWVTKCVSPKCIIQCLPPNASLLGKTLAHYTITDLVVMSNASCECSREYYLLHYYMQSWLTHMHDRSYSRHNKERLMYWLICIQIATDLQYSLRFQDISACMTISAICLHMHPGKTCTKFG